MAPIIDSHIHLYNLEHIPRLAWTKELPPDHRLNRENSIAEYNAVSENVAGVIFVETDRISGLGEDDWDDALAEVAFVDQLDPPVLGIVAWAPVPAGPEVVANYMSKATAISSKIKGVRYLVQDKPPGVMLQPAFIESLVWLGEQHTVFDLGIDARSGGIYQLREACEMLKRVYLESSSKRPPKIVINHLCKPNLRLSVPDIRGGHPEFTEWRACIETMASFKEAYMKMSGLFSELPPQDENSPTDVTELAFHLSPWTDVVFEAFGQDRVMFGSDWPVCNVGGPGTAKAWKHWIALIEEILKGRGFSEEQQVRFWSGIAIEAYGLKR